MEARVRGVTLRYEIVGGQGPMVALTPGSRRSHAELVPLGRRIAEHGFRVLLHDRRNCGASDVAFDGSGSEHEVWADDLHALAGHLGETAIWVGGSSAGARLALLYALRHPEAARGLVLWRVTGGREAVDRLAQAYYGQFIEIARNGGMAAVCESEHFRACIRARASNRERLLGMDVEAFVKVMQVWREHFLQSATLPIVGATEAQLRALRMPVCLIAGNDVIHTPVTARLMARLVPGAELHEDVVSRRPDDALLHDWDVEEWRAAEPRIVEIFATFMRRFSPPA